MGYKMTYAKFRYLIYLFIFAYFSVSVFVYHKSAEKAILDHVVHQIKHEMFDMNNALSDYIYSDQVNFLKANIDNQIRTSDFVEDVIVTDSDKRVIISSVKSLIGEKYEKEILDIVSINKLNVDRGSSFYTTIVYDKKTTRDVYYLIFKLKKKVAGNMILNKLKGYVLTFVVLLIIIFLLIVKITNMFVSTPIQQLIAFTKDDKLKLKKYALSDMNILKDTLQKSFNDLKEEKLYSQAIVNSQRDIVIITNGTELTDANESFFNFFKQFSSLEEFKKYHDCICDYFEDSDIDDYITYKEKTNSRWIKKILNDPGTSYFATISMGGEKYIFSLSAKSLSIGEGQRYVVALKDVTLAEKYKQNLEVLIQDEITSRLETEHKYRYLFDTLNEGVVVHSFDENKMPTRFVEVNDKMCDMFGYTRDELYELTPQDISTEDSLNEMPDVATLIHQEGIARFEVKLKTKKGEEIICELTSKIVDFMGKSMVYTTIKDVTNEKELVEEIDKQQKLLIQQSKLADMGSMISAIAHQWKQPLNIISLSAAELDMFYEDDEVIKEVYENVINQVKFMSDTINDFRSFFSPSKEKHYFSIIESIRNLIRILLPKIKTEDIAINIEGDENIKAYGFRNEFMQVVMNLINNARDAINDNEIEEGVINITVSQEQDIVITKISDNAGGIPDEYMPDKVFEPYFTTKNDKGTGIGLSMSKTIIERYMNGIINVYNIDDGAEFIISLPAIDENTENGSAKEKIGVLFVEDEKITMEKMSALLDKYFETVVTAENGEKGLENFKKNKDLISVVVTDIDMPVMNGMEMSAEIKNIAPEVPIIVLTALKEDVIKKKNFEKVLDKPVNIRKLVSTIKGLIDL